MYSSKLNKSSLLVVSPIIHPCAIQNGIALRIYNLLNTISYNYNIELITCSNSSFKETEINTNFFAAEYFVNTSTHHRHKINQHTKLYNYFPSRYLYSWPSYNIEFHKALLGLLDRYRYDAIYCSHASTYGYYLYDLSNLNVICDVCDSTLRFQKNIFLSSSCVRTKLSMIYNMILTIIWEYKYLSKCKKLTVISKSDKKWLSLSIPKSNIDIIPNGVDTDYFNPDIVKPTQDSYVLCFTGVMNYDPNHDAMMYCLDSLWPRLKTMYPDLKLKIVGPNPKSELIKLADLSPDVEITGRVKDIRKAVMKSAIFFSPMRLGAGMKNKHLEAMAMGIPLITTIEGAAGISLVSGYHAIIANTEQQLISSVSLLIEHPLIWNLVSKQARILVNEMYSWDKSSQLLSGIL